MLVAHKHFDRAEAALHIAKPAPIRKILFLESWPDVQLVCCDRRV